MDAELVQPFAERDGYSDEGGQMRLVVAVQHGAAGPNHHQAVEEAATPRVVGRPPPAGPRRRDWAASSKAPPASSNSRGRRFRAKGQGPEGQRRADRADRRSSVSTWPVDQVGVPLVFLPDRGLHDAHHLGTGIRVRGRAGCQQRPAASTGTSTASQGARRSPRQTAAPSPATASSSRSARAAR